MKQTPIKQTPIKQDPIVNIYHFMLNGEYTATSKSSNDPLAGKRMLPARSTTIALPATAKNEVAVFDEATQAWIVQPDFRGTVYRTSDGTAEQWQTIGALPATHTNKKPTSPQHSWDAKTQKWTLDLARVRADKINALKADYQALRQAGVNYVGALYQADDASINTLASTLIAAANGWSFPAGFAWIDASNTPHQADLAFLQGLAAAMANAKAQQFGQLHAAKNAVKTATTKTAINAVVL